MYVRDFRRSVAGAGTGGEDPVAGDGVGEGQGGVEDDGNAGPEEEVIKEATGGNDEDVDAELIGEAIAEEILVDVWGCGTIPGSST